MLIPAGLGDVVNELGAWQRHTTTPPHRVGGDVSLEAPTDAAGERPAEEPRRRRQGLAELDRPGTA